MRQATECDEGVTRQGEFQPCQRAAVAVRICPESGELYPVCVGHVRHDMVALKDAAREVSSDEQ